MNPQIHTLNFVGRQEIESGKISISGYIGNTESHLVLSKFDVQEYGFEPSAKVIIEISTTKYGMLRIDAGELHALNLSTRFNVDIDANGIRSALVDINVVSTQPESRYKIIGTAKRLRLAVDGRKVSILPHVTQSLGGEVWRLGFDDSELPILYLNNQLEDGSQVAESKDFRATVMPTVVEKIASWLLEKLEDGGIEDPGVKKWEKTFVNLGCQLPDINDAEACKRFPEEVAKAFAKEHNFIEKYLEFLEARAS